MENKNINDRRQDGQGAPGQKQSGWLKYPRKAMSGVVYSATIVIMLAVSLLFSFTLTAVVSSTGTELEILQEQDWYKYLSYGLYQAAYIAVVLLFAFLYRQKPRDFGYRKTHPKYFVIALLAAPESPYASFHSRQALKLEIVNQLLLIVSLVLVWTFIVPILGAIAMTVVFVVRVICFFQVCSGKAKDAALIGSLPFLK